MYSTEPHCYPGHMGSGRRFAGVGAGHGIAVAAIVGLGLAAFASPGDVRADAANDEVAVSPGDASKPYWPQGIFSHHPADTPTDSTSNDGEANPAGPAGSRSRDSVTRDPSDNLPADQINGAPTDYNFGWGAWQPMQMNRPLVKGESAKPLTAERRALLGRQLQQAREAGLRVGTVAEAEDAGYVKVHDFSSQRGYEYVNFDYVDRKLDIDHPEVLAFPSDEPDAGIAAIAYYVVSDLGSGPPDTFPLEAIPWHSHWDICQVGEQYLGSQEPAACADMGGKTRPDIDGWMLDLWVIPGWENPWGLVSSKHPDLREDVQPPEAVD